MIRCALTILLFCSLLPLLPAYADSKLETVENLQHLFEQDDNRVLLLLVSQPGCHYCELIKEEILQPMQVSGHYDASTIIRVINIYAGQSLKDFSGKQVDATAFAKRYDAWATPTLLFLDRNGNQIADKMVGINTPEFYGYYVDKSLSAAQASINQ